MFDAVLRSNNATKAAWAIAVWAPPLVSAILSIV
jgi:hypothetical protein